MHAGQRKQAERWVRKLRTWTGRLTRDIERKTVGDRKSTRLNSSHLYISYAVFCLKKKPISIFPPEHFQRERYFLYPINLHFWDLKDAPNSQDVIQDTHIFFLMIRRPPSSPFFPYTPFLR